MPVLRTARTSGTRLFALTLLVLVGSGGCDGCNTGPTDCYERGEPIPGRTPDDMDCTCTNFYPVDSTGGPPCDTRCTHNPCNPI